MGRFLSGEGSGFGSDVNGPHTTPIGGIAILPGPRPGYVLADGLNLYLNGPRSRNLLTTVRRSLTNAPRPGDVNTPANRGASNGTRFVCATNANTTFLETSDGVTWTPRTVPAPSSGNWMQIAWNGTIFCAINDTNNDLITSADGITWTARAGLTTAAGATVPRSIAAIGTRFVVCYQNNANVFTSTDGITWASSALPAAILPANTIVQMVSNGSSIHLLASHSGGFTQHFTSTNGTSWTNLSSGVITLGRNGRTTSNVIPLALSTSGVLLAFDSGNSPAASILASYDNGATWTIPERFLNLGTQTFITATFALGLFWLAIQSEYAASSPGNSPGADIYTSADGVSWERRSLPHGCPQVSALGVIATSSVGAACIDALNSTGSGAAFTGAYTTTNRTPIAPASNNLMNGGTAHNQSYLRVS